MRRLAFVLIWYCLIEWRFTVYKSFAVINRKNPLVFEIWTKIIVLYASQHRAFALTRARALPLITSFVDCYLTNSQCISSHFHHFHRSALYYSGGSVLHGQQFSVLVDTRTVGEYLYRTTRCAHFNGPAKQLMNTVATNRPMTSKKMTKSRRKCIAMHSARWRTEIHFSRLGIFIDDIGINFKITNRNDDADDNTQEKNIYIYI